MLTVTPSPEANRSLKAGGGGEEEVELEQKEAHCGTAEILQTAPEC